MSTNDPKKPASTDDAPVIDQMGKDEEAEAKREQEVKAFEHPIPDDNRPADKIVAMASQLTQKAVDRLNDLIAALRADIKGGNVEDYKKQLKEAGNHLRRAGVALDVAGGDTGENPKEAAMERWTKQKLFEDEVGYLKTQAEAARSILLVARQTITEGLSKDELQSMSKQLKQASQELSGPRSILAKVKGYVIPKIDQKFEKAQDKADEVGKVQMALDRAITETGDAIAYCDNNAEDPDFQQYAEHLDSAVFAIAEADFGIQALIGWDDKKPAAKS